MGADNILNRSFLSLGPLNRSMIDPDKLSILENIKSELIQRIILNNLQKKKSLELIKYNKRLQDKLNLSLNDYKEYLGKYSLIELEIIPLKNKFGEFINIYDKDDYYHIFFNNRKREIKRNYLLQNENVTIIKVIIDYHVKSFYKLFDNCKCIKSINFKKFCRNNISNMSYMFNKCSSIKELNLSNFQTNNVKDMSFMFFICLSLKKLYLNNFITNKVTDISFMFSGCSSLKELDLKSFNTNNVTDMRGMFSGCSSILELNLNNFDTNNIINMSNMFYNCSSLKELNIINFKTNNVKDMGSMFFGCSSLKEFNINNNFITNNLTIISHMFSGCSNKLKIKIKTQYKNIKKEAFE